MCEIGFLMKWREGSKAETEEAVQGIEGEERENAARRDKRRDRPTDVRARH